MNPFYRWAGGKRWLAEGVAAEIAAMPSKPTVYVEPFLGAGAVALQVEAERYLLGEYNEAVINLWQQMLFQPRVLYTQTRIIEDTFRHTEEGYASARSMFNDLRLKGRILDEDCFHEDVRGVQTLRLQLAALVLYLLAHGYNGLWRENKTGEYNVPFGGHHQRKFRYPDETTLIEVAARMRGRTTFFPTDFAELIRQAPPGSLIYADPPYVGTFDQYTKEGFSDDEQRRLAKELRAAWERGCHVIASNAYHPLIHEIYDWAIVEDVAERWSVGSKKERRGKAACVLIRSRES